MSSNNNGGVEEEVPHEERPREEHPREEHPREEHPREEHPREDVRPSWLPRDNLRRRPNNDRLDTAIPPAPYSPFLLAPHPHRHSSVSLPLPPPRPRGPRSTTHAPTPPYEHDYNSIDDEGFQRWQQYVTARRQSTDNVSLFSPLRPPPRPPLRPAVAPNTVHDPPPPPELAWTRNRHSFSERLDAVEATIASLESRLRDLRIRRAAPPNPNPDSVNDPPPPYERDSTPSALNLHTLLRKLNAVDAKNNEVYTRLTETLEIPHLEVEANFQKYHQLHLRDNEADKAVYDALKEEIDRSERFMHPFLVGKLVGELVSSRVPVEGRGREMTSEEMLRFGVEVGMRGRGWDVLLRDVERLAWGH